MSEFDDKPITLPDGDKFGFNALAETVADSISRMTRPEGTVIAINGPWGSGKSSFINLVRHHLDNSSENDELTIVDFKCWWFRGEEALTVEFFRKLYSAMESSDKVTKKAISKLGSQLLIKASQPAGAMINLFMPSAGSVASKSMEFIARLIEQDETVDKLHKELSDALNQSSKRYLVVIDDIDRLTPDEAMLVFQLVKSVGGLPKVMYLLAYDRQLAEKIVTERYPSEGPHYLEKIVQANFDLPEPNRASLEREFLTRLDKVIENKKFGEGVHFRSLFAEMIAPEVKTPRDLVRILNPLQVTWPAVKGEVDIADFLCIETLRVQRPGLYRALRSNKNHLTTIESSEEALERGFYSIERDKEPPHQPSKHPPAQTYENIFLKPEPENERERLRRGLMRLFPALARIWSPKYGHDSPDIWDRQRRVCSPKHFDTYFRFALPDDILSSSEVTELIAGAGNPEFIKRSFLDAVQEKLANGATRASLLFDALRIYANEIADDHVEILLKSVCSIAYDLAVNEDNRNNMSNLRKTEEQLSALTFALTMNRPLEKRSVMVLNASTEMPLGWLVFLARWAYVEPKTPNNMPEILPGERLVTSKYASKIKDVAIRRIREAVLDNSLFDSPHLRDILIWWKGAGNYEEEIGMWTRPVPRKDVAVARMARAFTDVSPETMLEFSANSQHILTDTLKHFVDLEEFRNRAEEIVKAGKLNEEDLNDLRDFLDVSQKQKEGRQ